MEEDAGKLLHELDGAVRDASYVDFNRTGVPLIEIVSEPDITSPRQAAAYLRSLRSIVQYLEVCDGNMEQGSFRCDANISLRPCGSDALGTKVEVKNMNSFRNVMRALEYEIERQNAVLEDGERIVQETRLWDCDQNVTFSMRTKEEAHDYRYFPDPDLVPLVIDGSWVEQVRETIPELPDDKFERYIRDYSLPADDARLIAATRQLADYFEACVTLYDSPKHICNWITGSILREVQDARTISHFSVTPAHLTEMLRLIDTGVISGKIAKTVFSEMCVTGKAPAVVIEQKGLVQVSDESELAEAVQKVMDENPAEVEAYLNGKEKLFGFFVGQVMKVTKGKANPKMVNDMLRSKLAG